MEETELELPTVNPVGVLERPAGVGGEPLPRPLWLRLLALLFLTFFFFATVLSSILSSGAYCLTSDGGDTRALHSSPVYQRLAETTEKGSGRPAEDPRKRP